MLYSSFLHNVNSVGELRKAYLLYGEDCLLRDDAIQLMEHKARQTYNRLGIRFSKVVFNLAEMRDEIDTLFMDLSDTFVVYNWHDGVLSSTETKEFFEMLLESKGRASVIVGGGQKLHDVFDDVFGTRQHGQIVECTPPIGEESKRRVVKSQFLVTKCIPTKEAVNTLMDFPLDALFNIVRVVRWVGVKSLTSKILYDLDLLREGIEFVLMKILLEKGKSKIIRRPDLNKVRSRLFLRLLWRRLVLLIRVKGQDKATLIKGSATLDIEYNFFKYLRGLAQRFEVSELYKKLDMIINLTPIADNDATYLVLLHYW